MAQEATDRPGTEGQDRGARRWLSAIPDFDPRSIGLFRIILGLCLIGDLLLRKLPYVGAFYSDQGVMPRWFLANVYSGRELSLFNLLGSDGAVYVFLGVTLALYGAYTLGFRPRLAGALAYACLWSIQQRNPWVIFGVDYILNCLLFWSLFLPLDVRFAVGKRGNAGPVTMPRLAVLAMLLQIAFIYLGAGLAKYGETWMDGTAIRLALTDTINGTAAGGWLFSMPALTVTLTYLTLVFEWFVILLFLSPFRNGTARMVGALIVLAFNAGLAPFLFLGPFVWLALAQLALLLPGWVWDRWPAMREGGAHTPHAGTEDAASPWLRARDAVLALLVVGLVWANLYPIVRDSFFSDGLQRLRVVRALWPERYPLLEYSSVLNQDWSFFAPNPSHQAGWPMIAAQLRDGAYVDLLTGTRLPWEITSDSRVLGDYRAVYGDVADAPSPPTPPPSRLMRGSWKDFADYLRIFYGRADWQQIMGLWSDYEAAVWSEAHPDRPLDRVDVILVSVDAYAALENERLDPELYLLHFKRY